MFNLEDPSLALAVERALADVALSRGYAVLHGGPIDPVIFERSSPLPVLLVAAEDDTYQRSMMERLRGLTAEQLPPPVFALRPGGHMMTDWDVAVTLAFFDEVAPAF